MDAFPALTAATAGGGRVEQTGPGRRRLELPAGAAGTYRLAQLSDGGGLARRAFPHGGDFSLALNVRAASADLPGTWGMGFWNEPFGVGIGRGGGARLPELPNAAWYFHASAANFLSLRDDLAGNGFLAQVFRSPPGWPFYALAPGLAAGMALLAWPAAARLLRRLARGVVCQAGSALAEVTDGWHSYRLDCRGGQTDFAVDGRPVLATHLVPRGRLSLVIWIDNQFAAFGPDGKIHAGLEENPRPAWIEIDFEG